jgi:hypothetical protein
MIKVGNSYSDLECDLSLEHVLGNLLRVMIDACDQNIVKWVVISSVARGAWGVRGGIFAPPSQTCFVLDRNVFSLIRLI